MLAAVNGALNYFQFTFPQKVYAQINAIKAKAYLHNFLDDGITRTIARKFQYLYQIIEVEISSFSSFSIIFLSQKATKIKSITMLHFILYIESCFFLLKKVGNGVS